MTDDVNDADLDLDLEDDVDDGEEEELSPEELQEAKLDELEAAWEARQTGDSEDEPEEEPDEDAEEGEKDEDETEGEALDPEKYIDVTANDSKLVRFKSDGQEVELPLKDVLAGYAHHEAADRKFREAADATKRAGALIERLRAEPFAILEELLGDEDAYNAAETYLGEKLSFKMLPESEQRRIMAEKELEFYKKRDEDAELAKKQQAREEMWAGQVEPIGDMISSKLQAQNMPVNEKTSALALDYIDAAVKNSEELQEALEQDVPGTIETILKHVMPLVEKDYLAEATAYARLFGVENPDDVRAALMRQATSSANEEGKKRAERVLKGTAPGVKKNKDTTKRRRRRTDRARIDLNDLTNDLLNEGLSGE